MNALIFLVPEDIVDVRPRLVCPPVHTVTLILPGADLWLSDLDLRRELDEHRSMMKLFPLYGHEFGLQYVSVFGKQCGERKTACCTAMEYDQVRMNGLFNCHRESKV